MTSKQFSPEWCEAAAAEIERQRDFINTQRENLGVQDAEITRLQGWEKEMADMTIERDEAREAARFFCRVLEHECSWACDNEKNRLPWLEEDH